MSRTSTKMRFTPTPDQTLTSEQVEWMSDAYKTILRVLKKKSTYHVNDFWTLFKGGDFPRGGPNDRRDNRMLAHVTRQVINDGHMINPDDNLGYRVIKDGKRTGTFKPRFNSRLYNS